MRVRGVAVLKFAPKRLDPGHLDESAIIFAKALEGVILFFGQSVKPFIKRREQEAAGSGRIVDVAENLEYASARPRGDVRGNVGDEIGPNPMALRLRFVTRLGARSREFRARSEAFYTTKPGGLRDLGRSICRSIIEAHGGRLWASANVPRGAIFQFTVPVQSGGN